ncbi:RNA-dependent RNA polymerase, eukaryotic-type [Corchorus capsularis]|uniref:RNA-dependent RNA polymerase n=1 Tax=Corchorus capsularis TaxID=210143 RepID=A0A1R3JW15_COCAP|nr:RNA-dependent RNA polymerase, eukaryotic-type [Corchorus capsularis]
MGKTIQVSGFLSGVTAENVKTFLESYTGQGTVYALKLRQQKKGGRAYAIVQFTRTTDAELIIKLANQRLYYGSSYLKAREMENDIVPRPRTFLHTMRHVKVHFGCQVSNEKIYALWEEVDFTVNFGMAMRKLQFLLSHRPVEYKLELSYENIWQIELRRPRDRTSKYLLIQLFGSPRIYEKDVRPSGTVFDSPLLNYFMNVPDDQWLRTTDFTRSCYIGQSSVLCLELPRDLQLPNFRENFAYYKESEGRLVFETGSSYSHDLSLVPVVGPPPGVKLPFEILFKVNWLVQNGCIPGPALDANFFRMVDPHRIQRDYIEHALEKLYFLKECCYEPSKWLLEQYRNYIASKKILRSPAISLDDGLVYVRRVQITPSRVYFGGPEVNVSNRVLRHFPDDIDNFLRISFVDEELEKIHSTELLTRGRRTEIYGRILSALENGIVIGDKRFEFLAFSSSQLRENSAWMFASRNGLTAAGIRRWMGDFSKIKNVAKYAARLGQSFSSSTETLTVSKDEIEVIPDIEVEWEGIKYVFSDGIGKISAEFAKKVAKKCNLHGCTPSAFQIRIGGYKGVVAVDPASSRKLSLRRSMSKYDSDNTKLDVLAWSKYQPCFLNRQLITLLSTLGVPDRAFEKTQKQAVDQLNAILTDPLKAQEALELMSPGENTTILKEMLLCGYEPDVEPFLSMMLQTFRASKLLELRTKTRIFVQEGRSMMGCLDETRTLNYGEVFVQFSGSRSEQRYIVQGKVVVAKNPCLHPGDVRVLTAVNVPDLYHMVDCVVFPQKGFRPHPNECSGSDLDGDIYFVSWDPELIPLKQVPPMDYSPAPSTTLDHEVTIEEVHEYFTNYIVNDSLGIIANAHTVFADRESTKAMSSKCIELAKLFSIAVDFPKTGVPAEIPQELRVKEYPDFMEKPDKPTYKSYSVIGKLFREVKDLAPTECSINSFTRERLRSVYDHDMEVDGYEDYIDDAFYHKSNYDYKLGNLMDYYGIKTEAEILGGGIMKMSRSFTKKRDAEAISMAVRSLRKEARSWFNEKGSGLDSETEDVNAKASAWYHVTYHPSYWGQYNEGMNRDHFLSFPWCVYDKLIRIKKEKVARRAARVSDLQSVFERGWHI